MKKAFNPLVSFILTMTGLAFWFSFMLLAASQGKVWHALFISVSYLAIGVFVYKKFAHRLCYKPECKEEYQISR